MTRVGLVVLILFAILLGAIIFGQPTSRDGTPIPIREWMKWTRGNSTEFGRP